MNATFLIGAAEGVQWGDFLFYLLTFVVLIAAVKHFAWGPVTEMMESVQTKSQTISILRKMRARKLRNWPHNVKKL